MNLTQEPEIVNWPATHYVFVERIGPFMTNAPQAWQELHKLTHAISAQNQIVGAMSLYKIGPKIYRAGFSLAAPAMELPDGMQSIEFGGGKYSRFVLTGSYANLGEATGRAWSMAAEKIQVRDDFAIENYVNDPKTTPEGELITEILVPTV
jgi:DNA gyrase inhibitor GyrI